VLNDTNNNSSHIVKKHFRRTRVLLLTMHCQLYFDSHSHSLQFGYIFLYPWFLRSGKVMEKSEDQGKSGNLKVPGCKS